MAETHSNRWRPVAFTSLLILAAALAVYYLWSHYFQDIWTRDARVRAVVINVAPDVAGTIERMAVADNQYVQQGDVLFVIDQRRYQLALERAIAQRDGAREQVALRRSEAQRRRRLGSEISQEERQQASSAEALANADLQAAEAALGSAKLDLTRTEVKAPVSGYVTHLLAHHGDYAHAGEAVLTLVSDHSFWVEAYLKETQVHRIRKGDAVRVRLLGTHRDLQGRVEGIARGIANSNAAVGNDQGLPTVSPTFEWVRLAQRIPVHISLQSVPDGLLLAAGMTASVQVYPHDGGKPADRAARAGEAR